MKTQRITKRQALLVLITTIIGAVMQPVFRSLILWGGNGAWGPIIAATAFGMLLLLLTLRLADRFPGESAAGYLPRLWGRLLGYPLVLLLSVGFLLKAALLLRHVSEFFVSVVLPETPISAVMAVLLFLIAAGVLAELEGIVRFNQLVLPVIIFSLGLVFVASALKFSGWELLPLFDKGYPGLLNALLVASPYFSHPAVFLFIYPLVVDKDCFASEGLKTVAISGGVFLAIYLNIALTLGAKLGEVFTWPYLAVVENVPAGVERMEAIFMVVWFLAAFVTISLFVYVFALGVNQLFPRLRREWIGLASIPVIAYIALLSDNQPSAVISHVLVNRYTLGLFTATPLFSLALAMIRRKRGERLG